MSTTHPVVARMPWIRHVPNGITCVRLLLTAGIGICVSVPHSYEWTLALFIVAACSDKLDGWVAREFRVQSLLGAQLDSCADKLLIFVYTIYLIPFFGWIEILLCVVILTREILVLFFHHLGRVPTSSASLDTFASNMGKQKMVLQVVALGLYGGIPVLGPMVTQPFFWYCYHIVALGTLFAATVLTVWSGIDYWQQRKGRYT